MKPRYHYAADFVNGLAYVHTDENVAFIDSSGTFKIDLPPGTQAVPDASEGMIWFMRKEGKLWGLRDNQGRVILEPTYNKVLPFSEGLAAVNIGATSQFPGKMSGGKWGYVNKRGEVVVPIQYDSAGPFCDGLALVSDSAGTKFLDQSGKAVIEVKDVHPTRRSAKELEYVHSTGHFAEGLAPVHVYRSGNGQDFLTRFIDREGRTQLSVDGFAEEFHEGMAVIVVRGGEAESDAKTSYGYIDRAGKVIIRPQFGEAHAFSDGLAAVRTKKTTVWERGDTWGYIDRLGNDQVGAVFNEARTFRGGVAKVHIGGTLQVRDDAPPVWEGGEWWLIDNRGKKLMRTYKK